MVAGYLNKKNIVIIGGTSGLGLSASLSFVKSGARLVIVGKDEESCATTAKELGPAAEVICMDAREPETAETAIAACIKKLGGFDAIYHVAGGSGRKFGDNPLHELELEAWTNTIDLNLNSLMLSNRAAIRTWLKEKRGGSILNMGSVLGFSPSPRHFATHAYAAAKSAIIGFTKSIASYYANHDIRVNLILPGLVETPMAERAATNKEIMSFIKSKQPLDGGRIGKPEDLDGLACYFMSDYSRFTTGQVIAVDGGWSVSEGQMGEMNKS